MIFSLLFFHLYFFRHFQHGGYQSYTFYRYLTITVSKYFFSVLRQGVIYVKYFEIMHITILFHT